jgi:acetoacetate decarboxylase
VRVSEAESYLMPVSFGPIRPHPAGTFGDVLKLTTVYETDRDAVAALLPEPFEPADDAHVSVFYARCRGVNFLAGGGYNLLESTSPPCSTGRTRRFPGSSHSSSGTTT